MKDASKITVLVACEESQRVCTAFRERGFNAYSCDIQPCSGGHPEWHVQGDVIPLLNGCCDFVTMDDKTHSISDRWDLIIAHPPCTYLTVAGACNIPKHPDRIAKGFDAAAFFKKFLAQDCVAVENPVPMRRFALPKYDQIVRPWMFGHANAKPICLWLKGLPMLNPTKIIDRKVDMYYWVHKATGKRKSGSKWYNTNTGDHSRHRSKTFEGIAAAMAQQWGDYLLEENNDADKRRA